jgi:antitoxin ParD1/3/4
MSTMNISLPAALKSFVDEQVAVRGYGTSSEYIRELIRRELDRANLRALLQQGAASPVVGELNAPYFDRLRKRANARSAK